MSQGLILNQKEDIDIRFVSGIIGKRFIYWNKSSQVPAHPLVLGEDNSILYKIFSVGIDQSMSQKIQLPCKSSIK